MTTLYYVQKSFQIEFWKSKKTANDKVQECLLWFTRIIKKERKISCFKKNIRRLKAVKKSAFSLFIIIVLLFYSLINLILYMERTAMGQKTCFQFRRENNFKFTKVGDMWNRCISKKNKIYSIFVLPVLDVRIATCIYLKEKIVYDIVVGIFL